MGMTAAFLTPRMLQKNLLPMVLLAMQGVVVAVEEEGDEVVAVEEVEDVVEDAELLFPLLQQPPLLVPLLLQTPLQRRRMMKNK